MSQQIRGKRLDYTCANKDRKGNIPEDLLNSYDITNWPNILEVHGPQVHLHAHFQYTASVLCRLQNFVIQNYQKYEKFILLMLGAKNSP